jgi:hypothetical protein
VSKRSQITRRCTISEPQPQTIQKIPSPVTPMDENTPRIHKTRERRTKEQNITLTHTWHTHTHMNPQILQTGEGGQADCCGVWHRAEAIAVETSARGAMSANQTNLNRVTEQQMTVERPLNTEKRDFRKVLTPLRKEKESSERAKERNSQRKRTTTLRDHHTSLAGQKKSFHSRPFSPSLSLSPLNPHPPCCKLPTQPSLAIFVFLSPGPSLATGCLPKIDFRGINPTSTYSQKSQICTHTSLCRSDTDL